MANESKSKPEGVKVGLADLQDAWERDSQRALEVIRDYDPSAYLRLVAAALADEDED